MSPGQPDGSSLGGLWGRLSCRAAQAQSTGQLQFLSADGDPQASRADHSADHSALARGGHTAPCGSRPQVLPPALQNEPLRWVINDGALVLPLCQLVAPGIQH